MRYFTAPNFLPSRHRERRGKFVIRRHSYAPQPDRPSSIMHPLPDFEPFISSELLRAGREKEMAELWKIILQMSGHKINERSK